MELISITNDIDNLKKIINKFDFLFNKFNIKNLGIDTINNLKININKNYLLIKDICIIKPINEKNFLIYFKNIDYFKKINKINFFENYGFYIQKKKNYLDLTIPKLSLEFRNNIVKIIKNEFIYYKELIEINRKKFLNKIKNNIKSLDDVFFFEKKVNNEMLSLKNTLKNNFEKISFKILNE